MSNKQDLAEPEVASEQPATAPEPTDGSEQSNPSATETTAPASNDAEQQSEEALAAELQKQLKQAEAEAEENWDRVVRTQAEMENLKKRTQKDLERAHKYGLEKFCKELLVVVDSLELAVQASISDNPEVVAFRKGSERIIKQLQSVFTKFNIETLDPNGQVFNPELHQAISAQPHAEVEANTVLNVVQKGYALNGRLIRPAMVVVAQAVKPTNPQPEQTPNDPTNLDEQA